jgi:hypothetical protein
MLVARSKVVYRLTKSFFLIHSKGILVKNCKRFRDQGQWMHLKYMGWKKMKLEENIHIANFDGSFENEKLSLMSTIQRHIQYLV